MLAGVGINCRGVSVCLSIRQSQVGVSTESVKHRITQTMPHDNSRTLCKTRMELPPMGAPSAGGVG